MGNPSRDGEPFVRFRVHPATVPPMPPYWWRTESAALRRQAEQRRRTMSPDQRRLWQRLAGQQLGTVCHRGVVISGHVVDFFIPEARLILDHAPAPRFLGHGLLWLHVTPERLTRDPDGAYAEIQSQVIERAGVKAYTPADDLHPPPALPAFGSPRMTATIEAAISPHRKAA